MESRPSEESIQACRRPYPSRMSALFRASSLQYHM